MLIFLQMIRPQGTTGAQDREEKTKSSGRGSSSTSLRDFQKKRLTQPHLPHDPPTWGQIKTLTNQPENLVS